VKPFVVRWCESVFIADHNADPAALKAPQGSPKNEKSERAKATYKSGSAADRYASAVETMPPLANGKIAQESDVLAYVSDRIAEVDGDCTLKEAQRVFYCLVNMKKGSPFVFDKATRLWRGSRHGI
jgi:hypothetical protein